MEFNAADMARSLTDTGRVSCRTESGPRQGPPSAIPKHRVPKKGNLDVYKQITGKQKPRAGNWQVGQVWPGAIDHSVLPMLSTSSRSSLLGLKKGIFFVGTWTRAPVFGLRPMRARLCRAWKLPNPRKVASDARSSLPRMEASESAELDLVPGSQGTDDAVKYGTDDDVGFLPGHPNGLINLFGQIGPGHLEHPRRITKKSITALPGALDA